MKSGFVSVFFIFSLVTVNGFCGNNTASIKYNSQNENRINRDSGNVVRRSFFNETCDNLLIQSQAPLRFKNKNFLPVLIGVGCTAGMIFFDPSIDEKFRPLKTRYKDLGIISRNVTELGGTYGLGFSALFAGFSFMTDNKKGMETSRLLAESMISVTVWTWLGKTLSCRQRPLSSYTEDGDSHSKWSGPFQFLTKQGRKLPGSSFDAFPSGHTATAFALATVFSMQYGEHRAVPVISYTLATAVGITRMIEHEHWASDVLAGAFLGYLCAKQVCNHALNANKKNLQCNFFYMNKSIMTGCTYEF